MTITESTPIHLLGLPIKTYTDLVTADEPPRTAADLLALCRDGRLSRVPALSEQEIRQITTRLRDLGFDPRSPRASSPQSEAEGGH